MILPPPSLNGSGGALSTERIANRPIVCHALQAVAAVGTREIAVVAPAAAMADVRTCVENEFESDIKIVYLVQDGRPDLLGSLQAAAGFVGEDPTVAHVGDGLLGQRLNLVTDVLDGDIPDLLLLLHRSSNECGRLRPATQRLLGLAELNGSRSGLAIAGICLFGPGALRRVVEDLPTDERSVDLGAVAEHLAGQGRLEAAVVRNWRCYRGSPSDLLELNRIVLDEQVAQIESVDPGDNTIVGRVTIDPTAEVCSSIIHGPCIIGANARVANSYIGPYTSIGPGAEIEGAEIERSIVAEGARIMHVSGRIEGSTIGRRASIFRDFALPRALRLHVGEGVEVALD